MNMKRFWRVIRMYKREIYYIYFYAILIGLINLSLPIGIQAIVNFIQFGVASTAWVLLVGLVLVGIALTGFIQIFQLRIVENIQQDIFARSAFEFASRMPKIKLSQLEEIHAPELINRFFDTLTIQKGLPKILIDFSLATFQIVFGLMLLGIYSPTFILLGGALCLVLYVIFRISGPKGLQTSLKESKYKYKMAHFLEEIASANKSFKLAVDSKLHLTRTDEIAQTYLTARESHFQVLLNQFRYFVGFKILIAAGLLILGSLLVFNEQMNIGQFVASEIIVLLIINSVEKLLTIIETIYDVLTALEKIGYVTELELDEEKAYIADRKPGVDLELVNVGFSFPDTPHLLENFSLKIKSGAKVLLYGDNGSGKSTLLHLMGGLIEPSRGEILWNDVPLDHYNKDCLFKQIGAYFPTNQIFEGTIQENIAMGRNISEEDMSHMVERLGLKQFVSRKERKLDFVLDSGGKRLSKSTIQKILLARAVVHKPSILLLFEPVQLVKAAERKEIIDFIMDPKQPWTVIVVGNDPYWKSKSTDVIDLN